MGSYGIGVGRNMACIVEAHHDEKGIVWPAAVAPYAAHLVSIGGAKDPRVTEIAERLHALAARGRSATRSCATTATSRPASSSPTPSCSACRGSSPSRPRSLAAGGIEVTERATGERSHPVDEVERYLVEGFPVVMPAA